MTQANDDVRLDAWLTGSHEFEGASCVEHKKSIAAYSWDELKSIARKIAAACSRAEGLTIARAYCLVDDEFRLKGDTKGVVLEDGTTAKVRIVGFCHDELADGSGRAGISFEFADVPMERRMNADWTNEGGWHESEMRDWLNSVFWGMLPQDLSSSIVEVEKRTHCMEWDAPRGPERHVTGTLDRLWLLSMTEVYGRLSVRRRNVPSHAAIYDAEGTQYQLYSDHDVSADNYGFCEKGGASSWWWLRFARRHRFRQVPPRRLRWRLVLLPRRLRLGRVPRLLLLAIHNSRAASALCGGRIGHSS